MVKYLGITDENTKCDLCGKPNLKKTVVLDTENGIVYYGTDCAASALMGKRSPRNSKIVLGKALAVDYARKIIASHGVKIAQQAVWNKYGYSTQIRGDELEIWGHGDSEPFAKISFK